MPWWYHQRIDGTEASALFSGGGGRFELLAGGAAIARGPTSLEPRHQATGANPGRRGVGTDAASCPVDAGRNGVAPGHRFVVATCRGIDASRPPHGRGRGGRIASRLYRSAHPAVPGPI